MHAIHHARCGCQGIMPPQILKHMLSHENQDVREAARKTLMQTERLRGERAVRSLLSIAAAPSGGRRTVYDCAHGTTLSQSKAIRAEGGAAAGDGAVNRVYDGFGATRDFYQKVFGRNSIDGKGSALNGYVHYDAKFANAFWDGQQMVFGDGDGVVIGDTTLSLDVIAHELTHGVTQNTAQLEYSGQSGALNESISDVFGSLVKQYKLQQTADKADWLIGAEIFTPAIKGDALRSLKAPGSAYDDPNIGKDSQPASMDGYDNTRDDDGGVHTNSGIPNHAFYLAAVAIGGFAWKAAGQIWYESLLASHQTTQFGDFAATTVAKAAQLYGAGSAEQNAVKGAWAKVKVIPAATTRIAQAASVAAADGGDVANLLDDLSKRVARLEVRA